MSFKVPAKPKQCGVLFSVHKWKADVSLQGVTLTDLQEAERTFSRSRAERQAQEPQGDRAEDSGDRPESRARWGRSADDEVILLPQYPLPES